MSPRELLVFTNIINVRVPAPFATLQLQWDFLMDDAAQFVSFATVVLRNYTDFKQAVAGAFRAPGWWISRMPVFLITALFCLGVYLYKPFVQSSLDNQPIRWGAALLATGRPLNYALLGLPGNSYYSFRDMPDGTIRSHTPVGTAVLAAPFFAVAHALGVPFIDENIVLLDSLLATLLMAASAGMMSWLVRREGRRTAFFVGLAFGLGTAAWAVASRSLWQHTGEVFMLLVGMCLLDGERRSLRRTVAGLAALGFAIWCRPYMLPAVGILVLWEMRRGWKVFAAGGGVIAFLVGVWAIYNLTTTGKLLGTYLSARVLEHQFWDTYGVNLWGTLASPNRGMFVFSPVLLMAVPVLLWWLIRARRAPAMAVLAVASLAVILPRGAFHGWFGGHTYGSRTMLDSAPFLLIMIAPFVRYAFEVRRWLAPIPVLLLLLSAGIQYLGATRDFESWNVLMGMNVDTNAWNYEKSQIMHCLTNGVSTRGPLGNPVNYILPRDGVINVSGNFNTPYVRGGVTFQPPHGAQILPPEARMVFFTPKPMAGHISLQLAGPIYPFDPVRVECFLNGHLFHTEVMRYVNWEFRRSMVKEVPGDYFVDGINLLEFRTDRVFYPSASASPFGVKIGKIVVRPVMAQ